MSKRYSGKSFKDASLMKKPKLSLKKKEELKKKKRRINRVVLLPSAPNLMIEL